MKKRKTIDCHKCKGNGYYLIPHPILYDGEMKRCHVCNIISVKLWEEMENVGQKQAALLAEKIDSDMLKIGLKTSLPLNDEP